MLDLGAIDARSRELILNDKHTVPPYGPTTGTIQALQMMRKATPATKVDGDFLRANKIAPGNEYKVVGALRFLGVIDDDGRLTEKSRALKTVGSAFTLALQDIIHSAYRALFRYLDINKASKDDIYNYFITEARLGAEMAAKAARFFITLCRMAQIELNTETIATPRSANRKGTPNRRRDNDGDKGLPRDTTLILALTPDVAEMDVGRLTDLFRKLRTALTQSLEH